MTPAPPTQVFAILRMLIHERTGIRYGTDDAALIDEKLLLRADEAGFESLLDYYYFLRYDPTSDAEFSALIDSLVVNETYFFREYEGLKVVLDEFVMPAVQARGTARIWSAACATGEEPFTVAMMLAERRALDRVRILATDISERALARARAGRFGARSLRSARLPSEGEHRLDVVDGCPSLNPSLRQAVQFDRLNLLDESKIATLGKFEAILCRNVLIYFADDAIQKVIRHLMEALLPGGALLVGVSESLLRFDTGLLCEERKGVFIYRKPE